ncbi:MAG TPA: acyl-CoA dehydrogenase family protein [Solirubrobacteraceae bacterium]|nr:acyl-CoA dehydrogenase family protein [Solirubrobacteraceae bacterium]
MSAAVAESPVAALSTEAEALAAADEFALSLQETVIERDRAGELPVRELARLDASGLLGITVREIDGGPELPVTTLAEVIRRIAAVDPAIAQAPQGHYLMVDVVSVWASERQRHALFADVLAGRRLGNALAERGGHHAQDLRTRVQRRVSSLRLSGRKYYTTGALTSHWLAVSALDEDDRLVLAIVRRDAAGVQLDHDWNVMGQRATVSGGATFDDVEVEFVIDYQQAFEVPQQLGARAQLVHAAIEVGIAGGALRDAHWFVTEKARPFFEAARGGWGLTAAADPHTIQRFGRLATQVRAAELLLADAGAVQQEIGLVPADADAAARGSITVAQAKAFACETAVHVGSELFSMAGASAADEKHDLSRHWRNARTHSSHDPVDWKYHHTGNWLLSGIQPPNHGQL